MCSPSVNYPPMLLCIFILYQVLGIGVCGSFSKLFDKVDNAKNAMVDGVLGVLNKGFNMNREWPWCDPTLGCLDTSVDWYHRDIRPIHNVPNSRDRICTRFFIHTRESRNVDTDNEVTANHASSLDGSGFDASKLIKFVIHGYFGGGISILKEFSQVLLDHGDYNVFRLEYLGSHLTIFGVDTPVKVGGSMTQYAQAVANARVVGLEIGYLVNWMTKYYGLDPANVHLIGFSLGAHIAGYAGKQIPGLGRISGLEPAGPFFSGMPPVVRLDNTDAIFVDNYHTDGATNAILGFGTEQPMGNIDFYPNGGQLQPGCDPGNILMDNIQPGNYTQDLRNISPICSHLQAVHLFMDSLKNPCSYLAFECPNYESFSRGECGICGDDNIRCSPIGIRAFEYTHKERVHVKMYFDTNEAASFCL